MSTRPRARADPRRPVLRHDRLGTALGGRLSPADRGRAGCSCRGHRRDPRVGRGHREHLLEHRPDVRAAVVARAAARARLARSGAAVGAGRRCDGARGGAASGRRSRDPANRDFDDHLAGLEIMLAADRFSPEADDERARSCAPDIRQAHAPRRAAVARRARRHAGRLCARRAEPGRSVPRRRRDASRGTRSRVLPRPRAGALGRGHEARPAGSRGAGAATDRRHRFCGGSDSSRPPRFTRSARPPSKAECPDAKGAPAVPGLPASSCR